MYFHKFIINRSSLRVGLLLFCLFSFACQNEVGAGPKAPDFSLKDLDGKTVTLKQHRGKVVVLDFWASWCPPCRSAIPGLVELQEKYKSKGLVVLGISMDDPNKADNKYLREFCEKFKVNYVVLRKDQQVVDGYFGKEGIALPTLFVIDREGKGKDKLVGYDHAALEKSLGSFFK